MVRTLEVNVSLSPKHERYAERLRELIEEGHRVVRLVDSAGTRSTRSDPYALLQTWFSKAINIIEKLLGTQSYHFGKLTDLGHNIQWTTNINEAIGVLAGALDDLDQGFLTGQELLVAAEVFDSILEQAKHLNKAGYKDCAAVLARIVLEDALKRIAREQGLDDTPTASMLNDELWKTGRYPKPQWRLVKVCLDVGNAAAHGSFDEYDSDDVGRRIEDVERFLATEFRV